jgi:arsenate reductase
VAAALPYPPAGLGRQDERFRELGLDAELYSAGRADAEMVVKLLLAHPELMQRPILRVDDRAAIGRPTERALALL